MKKIVSKYLWMTQQDENYRIGLTNEGQEELGNITFVTLPKVGQLVQENQPFADVEAEKAVTELVSPVSGTVKAINEEALNDTSILDSEDEEKAWLLVLSDITTETI